MVRLVRWMLAPALIGWSFAAAPVAAQTRTEFVQDEAALFSKDAKNKANAEIAQIVSHFKREFVVDTVVSVKVPPDVDHNNKDALKRYFDGWAEDRAGREKVNGVYVVIVGEPRTIRVELGNRTKQAGLFDEGDRQDLRKQLIANMTEVSKDPKDQGKKDHVLLAATKFVHERMNHHKQQVSRRPQQAPAQRAGARMRQGRHALADVYRDRHCGLAGVLVDPRDPARAEQRRGRRSRHGGRRLRRRWGRRFLLQHVGRHVRGRSRHVDVQQLLRRPWQLRLGRWPRWRKWSECR